MRLLRLTLLPALLVCCAILLSPRCALACSCMPPGAPLDALKESPAVFSGTVVAIHAQQGNVVSTADPVMVQFQVDQVWKGDVVENAVVRTARDGASCGYSFQQGQDYIVYTYELEGQLHASMCSATKPLIEAQADLADLGQGRAPAPSLDVEPTVSGGGQAEHEPEHSSGINPVPVALAGLLVVLIGVAVVTGRQRRGA